MADYYHYVDSRNDPRKMYRLVVPDGTDPNGSSPFSAAIIEGWGYTLKKWGVLSDQGRIMDVAYKGDYEAIGESEVEYFKRRIDEIVKADKEGIA